MEPWYKTATPRKEVREGRSFNPDEFAIALEQVKGDGDVGSNATLPWCQATEFGMPNNF
jgi:hypothetical protein